MEGPFRWKKLAIELQHRICSAQNVMTDRHDRIQELFLEAVRIPVEMRGTFLDNICGADANLRAEIERLMEAETEHSSFIGKPGPIGTTAGKLSPGLELAGRFRVIRFLAGGGMGDVYEVEDQALHERVAMKTIRPEIVRNAQTLSRFKREIQYAKRVTHPNVCRIHDLGSHHEAGSDIVFLTMELLCGETLTERLRRTGRINAAEALPLVVQMAGALSAAHDVGIIHRDFKTSNVILVGPKAVVTDFGLARSSSSTDDATLTDAGHLVGTPAYMAPEQLTRGKVTCATDIYALGLVMFEMITGHRPFEAGTRTDSALKRLTDPPPSPASYVPGLNPRWETAILRCLAREPEQRYQQAREVVSALTSNITDSPTATLPLPPLRPFSRRARIGSFVVASGLCVGLAGSLLFSKGRLDDLIHPLPQHRFVALIAEPAPTAEKTALLNNVVESAESRLIRSESYVKDLLIISPRELSLQQKSGSVQDALQALGANLVLRASIKGPSDTLGLEVLNADRPKVLRRTSLKINPTNLAQLPEQAAVAAEKLLSLPPRPIQWKDQDQVSGLSASVYQIFAAAEEQRKQPNDTGLDQAIEGYQQALDTDPHFALGYAKIALAYTRKYQITHEIAALAIAEKNAQLAIERNPDSPNAILSQALVNLYSGHAAEALDSLAKAQKIDPGDPQILLYQAVAYRNLGRPADEENAYRSIIKQRPNFFTPYNELGLSLYRQGRYAESATVFQEAAQVAPRRSLPLTNLGNAYLLLGRKEEAMAAFRASLDRAPNELAYLNLGNISFEEGDYRKALDSYQKARDLKPSNDVAWRNIADCYSVLGDRQGMVENYDKAAKLLSEQLNTNPANGPGWMTLAFYEAKLSRRTESEMTLNTAESRGAADVESQFVKAQALAVLGRKGEAISLLVSCVRRGLSPVEIQLALDLKEVRSDPRFLQQIAKVQLSSQH